MQGRCVTGVTGLGLLVAYDSECSAAAIRNLRRL